MGAICATAVLAFVFGGLTGPLAFAAPTLLALLVGLLLAHLLVPVAARSGRRLLGRGRVSTGVSLLHIARRPATRRVLALLTVATALLVFSADALAVGARNRTSAAEQENGAALVVRASTTDYRALMAVLRQVDPSGRRVTPVVTNRPPGEDGLSVRAVDPAGFGAVALFPALDKPPSWGRLAAPPVAPVRLQGTTLSAHLSGNVTVLGRSPH